MDTRALRRVARGLLLGSLPVLVFLACRWNARRLQPVVSVAESVVARRIAALHVLVAAAERGALLDFEHVLVVVDQGLVQDLLTAALPLERTAGAFRIRLDSAEAVFGDGLALVLLRGQATLIETSVTADLEVYGGLEVVGLDPASGVLRCQLRVFGVEAEHANLLGIDEPLRGLARALGQGGLEVLLRSVEIPVRIDDHLELPAVNSKRVRIHAASLPIRAQVAAVQVFAGKLWVALVEQPETPARAAGR